MDVALQVHSMLPARVIGESSRVAALSAGFAFGVVNATWISPPLTVTELAYWPLTDARSKSG